MAYIETHQSLFTHRKTLRLARLLQIDVFAVVGRLMALWCWALDNAPGGIIHAEDGDLLEDILACPDIVSALIAAGFLDVRGESSGWAIHDWDDYAGKLNDRRERNKLAMRAARARDAATQQQSVYNTNDTRVQHVAPRVDLPYLSVAKHTKPERENARADVSQLANTLADDGATTGAAPVSLSLSLSEKAPRDTPEAEPEPIAASNADHPLHEVCVEALGHGPTTGRMRRKWRAGLEDLTQIGVTAEDIPKLVAQYHAKFGNNIPCEPWNLADHYPELAVRSELYGTSHPAVASTAQQRAAAKAEHDTAQTQARHAGIAAMAAQLAPG